MDFNNKIIPEVISNFEVYSDSDTLVGVTADMSIAELTSKVATITGAGIGGSYDVPVMGHYDSIVQEIPFRILYRPIFEFANPMKAVALNIRGAIQVSDKSTGAIDVVGLRYVIRGRNKSISPGNLKPGEAMNGKIAVEATYILYEIGGQKLMEIDKLNNICRINGVDLMEKVRKLC